MEGGHFGVTFGQKVGHVKKCDVCSSGIIQDKAEAREGGVSYSERDNDERVCLIQTGG
jgi:hypothetical protein